MLGLKNKCRIIAGGNMFVNVLGLSLYSGTADQISYDLTKKILINTMNPRVFTISRHNELLKKAFESTDYLIEDGQYFALAPLLLKGKYVRKVSGTNIFYSMMAKANHNKGKVFFLGASKEILEKMKQRSSIDYQNIEVEYYSPPYKECFSNEENNKMVMAINSFSPDILFIGMTAPKQEIWAYQNKEKIDARIICSVGAVFEWYAKVKRQTGKFWVKLGLEWMIRTIRRPELLKRYPDYLMFFWLLFLNVIRIRKD
jgi:N-acetylglucosaminyldiphosphoundecaprenol N-acetyl-beta-D-mannosaminyltransferase